MPVPKVSFVQRLDCNHSWYNIVYIYYCMTGRAIWENIQLDGGIIGPTEGRDNTEPES